jgi:hypothetical protein
MRWPGIGLIVNSGKSRPDHGDLVKKARFLSKPYASSTLLREVRSVLGKASGQSSSTPPKRLSNPPLRFFLLPSP